jgi:hypothetical protein
MKKVLNLDHVRARRRLSAHRLCAGNSGTEVIYRGEVSSISDNGDILVTQAAG